MKTEMNYLRDLLTDSQRLNFENLNGSFLSDVLGVPMLYVATCQFEPSMPESRHVIMSQRGEALSQHRISNLHFLVFQSTILNLLC